jgi:hypothetical protein
MQRFRKILLNNAYLKVIALILAVLLWVYIVYELSGAEGRFGYSLPKLFQSSLMRGKYIPVKATIIGLPSRGYHVNKDKVRIYPSSILAVGAMRAIESTEYLRTEPIDVTGRSETVKVYVPLEDATFRKEDLIEVIVPIEKD